MKKILQMLLVVTCLLTGCAGPSGNKTINVNETQSQEALKIDEEKMRSLAEKMAQTLSYDYPLSEEITKDSFGMYFELSGNVNGYLYMSTTASAEMVAVMWTDTKEDTDIMLENVKFYMNDEYEDFSKYNPDEAQKIEDAVIVKKETLLVVSVSKDADAARKLVDHALEIIK